ncbi:MAG: phage tail protein, partial [Rhodobacter sp.]
GVAQSELALSLTAAEGRMIVERWLAEARVARDAARFALPKSALWLGAGDVVAVDDARYRIDRIEQAEFLQIEAVRVESAAYRSGTAVQVRPFVAPYTPPAPVHPLFLDLPLLNGAEVPDAPHVAVGAVPWPGPVAVWSSASDNGYALNRLVMVPATYGVTETALAPARPGLLSRGTPLRVRLSGGTLSSTDLAGMLNGANAAAVGAGAAGPWEVLQFTGAELVAPQVYDLTGLLRGQAGTEDAMPAILPAGSAFVLLDQAPVQIALSQAARGLDRHYRIGAAERGYDDASTVHRIIAFEGVGLRPYRPVHLRVAGDPGGERSVTWIRRTRIDGDGWRVGEVPLGEDRETYLVQVISG